MHGMDIAVEKPHPFYCDVCADKGVAEACILQATTHSITS